MNFESARKGCKNVALGVIGGSTLGIVGGASAAIVQNHPVSFYAARVGTNFGMLSCCFFGLGETLAFLRQKRDVWNPTIAGATSGFVCFSAYGGPRFGVLGSFLMCGVGYGGHHLGEVLFDMKDEFVEKRRMHLRKMQHGTKNKEDE